MKILFSLDKYSLETGGAPRTAQQVVAALSNMGHEIQILEHDGRQKYHVQETAHVPIYRRKLTKIGDNTVKYLVHNRQWPIHLQEITQTFKPDVILTQGHLAISTVAFAKEQGITPVVFMHGLETFDPNFFLSKDPFTAEFDFWSADIRQKIKYPLMRRLLSKYQAMFRTADHVVANSKFMNKLLKAKLGVDSHVLYPPIATLTSSYALPQVTEDSPILLVKPQKVKGVAIFHELAKKTPNRKFLTVGKPPSPFRQRLGRLSNVTMLDNVTNMPKIYRQAALILGPSLIPEPFGRVFVEAGFFGVPSVAFRTGGIEESVGEGGILLEPGSSVNEWIKAIEQALEQDTYQRLSRAAYSNAQAIAEQSANGIAALFRAIG